MLNVVMLNVVMLNVVMLNVVAPLFRIADQTQCLHVQGSMILKYYRP
jgi:hypothetical protein